MSSIELDPPLKILIENLSRFVQSEEDWTYKFDENDPNTINVSKIHIQGQILKTAGFENEILIISDGTGKAKVTRGPKVPGELSWIASGVYCSVVGTLLDNGKLPHIGIIKIAKIESDILQEMWKWEVLDLQNFLAGKIIPQLPEDCLECICSN